MLVAFVFKALCRGMVWTLVRNKDDNNNKKLIHEVSDLTAKERKEEW